MANTRGKRKEILPTDAIMNDVDNKSEETEVTEVTETPSIKNGIVNCQNLNVRKSPTISSTVLKIIPKNTKVEILGDVNDAWYNVSVGEIKKGFCMKEFINII